MTTSQISLTITADPSGVERGIGRAKRSLADFKSSGEQSLGGVGQAASLLQGKLAAIGGGLSVGLAVGQLVQVQREFDALNSSLVTVAGGSAAAAKEMDWLKVFAKETPFGLAQATSGFVKMKALGLDPTRASLTSFGNTAAAMGKDLNQMIEAVADASTGEFERLKEFGIKAKKEGDQVKLTFQGVTTSIGNNAYEITKYLEGIGNVQFAGAMEERAKTLDGAIASLGDTWDELFRTISSQGVGDAITESVRAAEASISDLTTIIRSLDGATAGSANQTQLLAGAQEVLATAFEAISVLGVNVKYTLVQIGNELGGLAAQAVAVAKGQFSQAAEISRLMRADAEKARKEVDATSERILNARKVAALSAPNNYDEPAVLRARAAADKAAADAKAAAAKAARDAEAAEAARAAAAKEAAKEAKKAAEAELEWRRKSTLDMVKAWDDQAEAARKAYDAARAGALKLAEATEAAQANTTAGLVEKLAAMRAEIDMLGLTAEAQAELNAVKAEQVIADKEIELIMLRNADASAVQIQLLEQEINLRKQLVAAMREKAGKEASIEAGNQAKKAADDAAAAWQKASDDIERSLTDALMRGFESGQGFAENFRNTVANMFRTLVLRPIISAVVSPVAGAITGSLGLPGAANAASGISSLATGASALSGFGAFGSGVSSGLSAWGAGGSVTGLLGSGSSLFAGGVANGLGTLTGALGPVALGLGVLAAISKATKGENRFGGAYELTGDGVQRIGGAIATNTQSDISAVTAAIGQTNRLLETLGSDARVATYGAFVETSGKGRGGIFAGGNLSTGQRFGTDSDTRQYTSGTAEEQAARFAQELQQTTLLALQAATDIPKGVQQMLAATNIDALNIDQATALLAQIADYPNTLLQRAGTTRDALVQTFAQGLQAGDAAAAGQAVADQMVASIQQSMLGDAAGQIFDIVNRGIVTPVIDAMLAGQSVTEALSQASLDAVVAQATAKAQALGAVFNDPTFQTALATLRTNVGSALGSAGTAVAYTPPPTVVPAPAALSAVSSASAVGDAVVDLAQVFADAQASLVDTQRTLGIDLQRALGDEAGARAAERAAYLAGFAQLGQAEQDRLASLYDQTQAIRDQITATEASKEAARQLAADMQALASAADSSAAKFLSGDALTSFQTGRIAEQLNAATGSSLTGATLAALGIDQIRQAVLAFVASDAAPAAKTAVLQLGSSLVDLKTAAADAQRTTAFALADATFAGVERAAAAQRKLLETSRTAAEKLRTEVQSVFDTLQSSVDDLFGSVDGTKTWQAQQGQQFIAAALAAARATGALPDGKDLTRAITAARGGLDADQFRTQAEADFARLVLANELRDLQDISGNQLTEAERQAKAAEDALTALDASLETARDQLAELKGINTGVSVTLPAALAAFAASIAAAKPLSQTLTSSTGGSYSMATGIGTTASGQTWDRATVANAAADLLNAQGATAVYNAIKTSGYTLAQAEKIFGSPAGSLEEEARKMGLPVFHEGTNYVPKTGFALLEKGEAVIPAAYNPMANPGFTGGNTERLERLVEGLTAEVQRLQALVDQGNQHTGQLADQFDRVTANGNAMATEALA